MQSVRETAVAGLFYPDDAAQLQSWFASWMGPETKENRIPRAIIAPHAGYVYSGEAAAKGHALWREAADHIETVVVIGPAHRVGFHGISTTDHDAMATPLGNLKVDKARRSRLIEQFADLHVANHAHVQEHGLEVHFPFLKHLLPDVKVLPLLNGRVDAEVVRDVLQMLWKDEGVYFVISSDLSHFLTYDQAQSLDSMTAELIESRQWESLRGEHACGYKGIQGLLALPQSEQFGIERLTMLNSGDQSGDRSRVVGYGTWAIYESADHVSHNKRHHRSAQ